VSGTIAVIVVSFNRPRMLREALATVGEADQIILADDGSDTFDPRDVLPPDAMLIQNPLLPPYQRMRKPTCGALINRALRAVECDYVAYLCDDDLLAPGWLKAAKAALDADPASHMVRGDWLSFEDGQPLETAVPSKFDCDPPLTTGNFAHRTRCTVACGCWWVESTISCHDGAFLGKYLTRHGSTDVAHVGTLAGYRREHPYNMLRYMDGNGYRPETRGLFESGRLEAPIVPAAKKAKAGVA
jgi:hypothetical protein